MKKMKKMMMKMNAFRVIAPLVACFCALSCAMASPISEPAPQDICGDVDITIPDWKNYDVVRLFRLKLPLKDLLADLSFKN